VKQSLGGDANQTMTFKTKLKNWVKRSGSESSDQLSAEILKEIDCGKEYTRLCIEILEEGEQCSLAFFSDPMATARRAISDVTEVLMRCYQSSQNLYLVDEMNGVPVRSEEDINDDLDELVYPIELDRTVNMLRTLLLPFMNVAVMKLTAAEGLPALGKLLGLPHLKELPNSWLDGKAGLVHRPEKPSSIAEFAVLHEVMRRQEFSASPGSATLSHNDVAQSGDEMARLEDFFRGYDPVRTFADLRRVSDGKEGSPAIWTTEVEVNQMQSQLELASAEYKLRELKKEWIKRQKVQEEIQTLTNEIERLHGKSNLLNNRQDPSTTLLLNNERNSFPTQSFGQYNLEKESSVILHSERAAEKRPTKRKKTRFRPYFGAC